MNNKCLKTIDCKICFERFSCKIQKEYKKVDMNFNKFDVKSLTMEQKNFTFLKWFSK